MLLPYSRVVTWFAVEYPNPVANGPEEAPHVVLTDVATAQRRPIASTGGWPTLFAAMNAPCFAWLYLTRNKAG